jgi:hypothetical protein
LGKQLGDFLNALSAAFASLLPKYETVYRVYGGGSKLYGESWTPVDPLTVENYRDVAGLPDWNTGEFLAIGHLVDRTGIKVRPALALHGNSGGIVEYVISNPKTQILLFKNYKLEPRL